MDRLDKKYMVNFLLRLDQSIEFHQQLVQESRLYDAVGCGTY